METRPRVAEKEAMMTKEPLTEETEETVELRLTFPWYDEIVVTGRGDRADVHPVALAARAAMLAEALTQEAHETSPGDESWIGWGIGKACQALVATGDCEGLGVLFTGLETLVDPKTRANWPLHGLCDPLPGGKSRAS